ncbi:hypothetical protein CHUAL_011389 [Chamberlinius hualienensis]
MDETAIHWAAKHGNDNVIKLIAGTHGVNVNIRSGYTPLHLAAMFKHKATYELLASTYGADINKRDYSGKRAEDYLDNPNKSRRPNLGPTYKDEATRKNPPEIPNSILECEKYSSPRSRRKALARRLSSAAIDLKHNRVRRSQTHSYHKSSRVFRDSIRIKREITPIRSNLTELDETDELKDDGDVNEPKLELIPEKSKTED